MAINTLADWRQNGVHARQSILGRPRPKEAGRELDGEDEDEVQRSPATEHHIRSFFDALQAGNTSEQSHALAKIVDTWRADNNAGGLPVYAHQPLPSGFANELAKVVQSGPDGKPAAEGITAKLEPGARLSVFQQVREAVSNQVRNASAPQPDRPLAYSMTAIAGGDDNDNDLTSPFVTAQARPRQPNVPPPGFPQRPNQPPAQPGGPQRPAQPPQQQQAPWWQQPILPPQPSDPPLQESQSGNYVVPTARLSPGLRTYLGGLDWRNPTDNAARGQDNQGGGGFNGTRLNNGRRYPHGAHDQLAQPDQYVSAPVTGRLAGYGRLPGRNWTNIDIALYNGVVVRVIHVEMPRDAAGQIYLRPGDTIRSGQIIGTQQIFANNQRLRPVPVHAHIQIMVPKPGAVNPRNNGQVYYLVDPSLFIRDPDYVN